MTGYRPLDKVLANAIRDIVLPRLEQETEKSIFGDFLFGKAGVRDRSGSLTMIEKHISKIVNCWLEILDSLVSLDAAIKYLRKESSRPASVTPVDHLRYHFEHFLH